MTVAVGSSWIAAEPNTRSPRNAARSRGRASSNTSKDGVAAAKGGDTGGGPERQRNRRPDDTGGQCHAGDDKRQRTGRRRAARSRQVGRGSSCPGLLTGVCWPRLLAGGLLEGGWLRRTGCRAGDDWGGGCRRGIPGPGTAWLVWRRRPARDRSAFAGRSPGGAARGCAGAIATSAGGSAGAGAVDFSGGDATRGAR